MQGLVGLDNTYEELRSSLPVTSDYFGKVIVQPDAVSGMFPLIRNLPPVARKSFMLHLVLTLPLPLPV